LTEVEAVAARRRDKLPIERHELLARRGDRVRARDGNFGDVGERRCQGLDPGAKYPSSLLSRIRIDAFQKNMATQKNRSLAGLS